MTFVSYFPVFVNCNSNKMNADLLTKAQFCLLNPLHFFPDNLQRIPSRCSLAFRVLEIETFFSVLKVEKWEFFLSFKCWNFYLFRSPEFYCCRRRRFCVKALFVWRSLCHKLHHPSLCIQFNRSLPPALNCKHTHTHISLFDRSFAETNYVPEKVWLKSLRNYDAATYPITLKFYVYTCFDLQWRVLVCTLCIKT